MPERTDFYDLATYMRNGTKLSYFDERTPLGKSRKMLRELKTDSKYSSSSWVFSPSLYESIKISSNVEMMPYSISLSSPLFKYSTSDASDKIVKST